MTNKWFKNLGIVFFLVSFGALAYIAGLNGVSAGALQSFLGQETDDANEGVREADKEEAKQITKAAEQGDADAQFRLGTMYYLGRGVPKDRREAAKWFAKVAEQGHADAQQISGGQYNSAEGVPKDHREAAKRFTKVAEQGNAGAQRALVGKHNIGEGVPRDHMEAARRYTEAPALRRRGSPV